MKKLSLFFLAMAASFAMQAQWVNDPMTNTLIANCENSAAELLVAPSPDCGTFVQWLSMSPNGWSPKLQYLDYEGVPQWGPDGVHITTPNLATWSPGYALAATDDGAVISMFRSADAHHWVVKVNPDGSTPWGTDGMVLFNGEGGGRSELLTGKNGGFWALGTDMDSTFLQYVDADGTLRPMTTISAPAKKCTNGILIPSNEDVFVVYAKQTLQGYTQYNKEICVAKFNKEGEQITPETVLFGLQTISSSYIHYAISDGLGGGYVFHWHKAIGGAFNTYVSHFDANGTPTITEPNGIPVHSYDPSNFYINAYPTIDPATHDLLLVYRQTEAYSESEYKICVNRITSTGEKPWGDGILLIDNGTTQCGDLSIDAFEYLDGFAVIYHKAVPGIYGETIEAHGFDMDGNMLWSTQMCGNTYPKTCGENTQGYCFAQNVAVWVNTQDGGLYGQNIGEEGEMGEITIPVPPVPCCYEPDYFEGSYLYNEETTTFGAMLTWEPPAFNILHYNLYRQQLNDETTEVIEIDANATSYFDEVAPGGYKYQLTAQYEEQESGFALTPEGEDYIIIEVTKIPEYEYEEIIDVMAIYNIKGQLVNTKDINELAHGIYAIIGTTDSGKTIVKKVLK